MFRKDLLQYKEKDFIIGDPILYKAIISASSKLEKYLEIDKEKEELLFSIILDPRRKLSTLRRLEDNNCRREEIKEAFIKIYNK